MQEVDSCRPREQQRPILLSPSSQHHHRHHNPFTTTCIPIVAVLPPLFPSPWNYHQYIHSWAFSWTSSTTVSAPLILHTLSQCHHRRCNHCTTSNISIPVRMKPPSNFQCLRLHPLPPRVCSGWNSSRNRSFSLFFHFFILICFSFFSRFSLWKYTLQPDGESRISPFIWSWGVYPGIRIYDIGRFYR